MKSTDNQKYELLSLPGPKRCNYFTGQLLTLDDFQEEQDYFIDKHRQQNRAIFNRGIIKGLTLSCDGRRASVSAGFAMDSSGRLIELSATYDLNLPDKNGLWEIILELTEEKRDHVPIMDQALKEDAFKGSRIQENTKIWARHITKTNISDVPDTAVYLGRVKTMNGKCKVE